MISSVVRRVQLGTLVTRVLLLATGTAIGHLIVMVSLPVLARLYDPSEFGVYSVYTSVIAILAVIATLRYELAVPLADSDDDAINVLAVCGVSAAVLALALVFAETFAAEPLARWTHSPALADQYWLLPLAVMAIGSYQALSYWAARMGAFREMGMTRITQRIGQVIVQTGWGLWPGSAFGLIGGDLIGRAGGAIRLTKSTLLSTRPPFGLVTWRRMSETARRYWRFPTLSSVSGLASTSALQMPPILMASIYGVRSAGLFQVAWSAMAAPMVLLGQAVSQVFLAEGGRYSTERQEKLPLLYSRTRKRLFVIGVPIIGVLGLSAPVLFPATLGPAWAESGVFARNLSLLFAAQLIAVPTSQVLNVLESQHVLVVIDCSLLLATLGAFTLAAVLRWDATSAVLVYSLSTGVVYAFSLRVSILALRRHSDAHQHVAPIDG